MQLNLPILDRLSSCKNLLIVGMGGGFDIFCGLPIYFELRRRGQLAHLANFSFSDIAGLKEGIRLTNTLAGVTFEIQEQGIYFPELYLAQWFHEKFWEEVTVWCFHKTGVRPLLENYRALVKHLSIDGILLIDGGVDSLMRGDEAEMGTVIEDSISLCAVSQLTEVPLRLVACLGFGSERDISYAHVLENISALAESEGFLGSCSLLRQMPTYQDYESAVMYVQNKPYQEPSVINSSVISAVQGRYGDYHLTDKTQGSRLWISPLMSIYWFFEMSAIAKRHLFLKEISSTDMFSDVMRAMFLVIGSRPKRPPAKIPLS